MFLIMGENKVQNTESVKQTIIKIKLNSPTTFKKNSKYLFCSL